MSFSPGELLALLAVKQVGNLGFTALAVINYTFRVIINFF